MIIRARYKGKQLEKGYRRGCIYKLELTHVPWIESIIRGYKIRTKRIEPDSSQRTEWNFRNSEEFEDTFKYLGLLKQ